MSKQFFRVEGVYPVVFRKTGGTIPSKSFNHTGFLGCDMVQKHVIELLKEGVPEEAIKVFVDETAGPEVTQWQVTQAKKRMGRKV